MIASPSSTLCRDYEFASANLRLFARCVLPPASSWARLGLIHGYGDHSGRHEHVLQWMAQRGVACYTFDLRGHGRSPGRRGALRSWDEYLSDLDAFLQQPPLADCPAPLFLMGHSHGGLVLSAAAISGRLPVNAHLIFTSPYLRNTVPIAWYKRIVARIASLLLPDLRVPSNVRRSWLSSDPQMLLDREQDAFALNFATPRWFVQVRHVQRRVREHAPQLRLPFLMLLGSADPIADPAAGRQFFASAGSADKTLKIYDGFLHELLRESQREMVFEQVLRWMQARTGPPQPRTPR